MRLGSIGSFFCFYLEGYDCELWSADFVSGLRGAFGRLGYLCGEMGLWVVLRVRAWARCGG